jgi:tellurite methyltransferase
VSGRLAASCSTLDQLDDGRAVGDGRPADLLLHLGCDAAGRRGQAGSLLAEALPLLCAREDSPYSPLAVVFDSGGSVEALELLRRGWVIVAFDQASMAPPSARLTVDATEPADAVFPPADLIYTGACLPFRPPDDFAAVWGRIVRALRPGGWFVGHLLGDQDSWAEAPDVTSFSREQVIRLLNGFRIEMLREQDGDGEAQLHRKHWHVLHIVARRRAYADSSSA